MRIPCHPQVQKVADRLIRASSRDDSLLCETPEYLCDLKVQELRRMQTLPTDVNALLNSLSRSCLQKPVNCSRRIQDDHRASRSSRTSRAVSSSAETGLRLCRRSRNSASVGLSAISLISANR